MPESSGPAPSTLYTLGHGTATRDELSRLLRGAGLRRVIDVRSAPGSRRNPQFGRRELESWMAEDGFVYRWEPGLGGFRRPCPDSANVALRHPSFRGFADYMETEAFGRGLLRVAGEAAEEPTAVMCSESLWWRCHRRLIADAAALLLGLEVWHLGHDGRLGPHHLTEGLRLDPSRGVLVYDQAGGAAPAGDVGP